jgi:Ca-activated chloride channel family protein
MTFASPELLLALLLIPLAIAGYLFVQRRRSRYAVRFTNVDLLSNLVPKRPAWRRHVPAALYLVAIAALALALARPSLALPVPREEATIILTIDVSGSMKATDVQPTRLAAAQQAATDFLAQLPPKVRVGLVAFSTEPRTLVTPTTDRESVKEAIGRLRAEGGTALGDAIVTSLDAADLGSTGSVGGGASPAPSGAPNASDAPSQSQPASPDASASPGGSGSPDSNQAPLVATVLLSDGENSAGQLEPLQAADQAAALNVPIYTIALGTENGVVDVQGPFGPQQLRVPPDTETLAAIAETTGGRFFDAPTAEDLSQIYESLGSKIGYTTQEQEVTQLFAAAGLLFVVAGAALAAHWFNRFP